jgi:TonB family protein
MAQEVHTAFFSYCREDSEFALKLAEDLKVAGAHVWIDQLDIEPGTPWDRAVEEALNNAPRMLVVLSPVSVNSDNVRDEVSFALSRQKRVIPVLYRDCDVPFRLARLQHIDFRPDYDRALRILLRALGVDLVSESSVSGVPVHAAEAAISAAEAEEKAQQQKLEEGRLEQRRAAAEKAAREHEYQRTDAEGRAGDEKLRREQRAAEQARLEEEARQAAERARLAQEEQERLAAEIRARQEQLRREQQESVERRSMDLGRLEEQQRGRENQRAAAEVAASAPPVVEAPRTAPAKPFSLSFLGNKRNALYLAGAAILLVVIGVTSYAFLRRGNPQTPAKAKSGETTNATQAPQTQTPASQGPSSTASPASSAEGPPANVSGAEASGQKPPSENGPSSAQATDQGMNKAAPVANLSAKSTGVTSTLSSAEGKSGSPDRVRISEGVSKGWIVHKVKPEYPPLARQARVQGEVVLNVVIARNGSVKSIATESGHPMLIPAAIDAVKQWRYQPYKVSGRPVEVDTKVIVNFTLTN